VKIYKLSKLWFLDMENGVIFQFTNLKELLKKMFALYYSKH